MNTEYEATFTSIDKEVVRKKLRDIGARLLKPEVLYKRVVFKLPKGHEDMNKFVRVRDEQDKITMSFKSVNAGGCKGIEGQKEICLLVDSFENAIEFLRAIGCQDLAFQENKREIWQTGNTEIMIDEWPFLEPYVEIESENEDAVREVAEKLGFDYSKAMFCSTGKIYADRYHVDERIIHDYISKITFDMKNPFLNKT